jgi:hypothetical protein
MISLETSLQHLAWSNQKFFALFGDMPEEVFALRAAENEWPIGQLLTHLAGSGEWYRYCLTGIEWTELKPITDAQVALEYLPIIADLDEVLLANMHLPDELLTFEGENGPSTAQRSLILSQAVMHAAEHKGQIATILKQHGYHISLDDLDVWSFIAQTRDVL